MQTIEYYQDLLKNSYIDKPHTLDNLLIPHKRLIELRCNITNEDLIDNLGRTQIILPSESQTQRGIFETRINSLRRFYFSSHLRPKVEKKPRSINKDLRSLYANAFGVEDFESTMLKEPSAYIHALLQTFRSRHKLGVEALKWLNVGELIWTQHGKFQVQTKDDSDCLLIQLRAQHPKCKFEKV